MRKGKKHIKEQSKQKRMENKEKIQEIGKQYYQENKDIILEKNRKYQETNKEKLRMKQAEYRAKHTNIFHCECGATLTELKKSRHIKTKKHINFILS